MKRKQVVDEANAQLTFHPKLATSKMNDKILNQRKAKELKPDNYWKAEVRARSVSKDYHRIAETRRKWREDAKAK